MIYFDVLIRGRDCARTFPRTVRSLVGQSHTSWFPHVFLDDAPRAVLDVVHAHLTDSTCQAYSEHLGVAGNMSRALSYLTAFGLDEHAVIAVLDADGDTLPKDALRHVAHVYEKYPETLVTYGSYKKGSKGDRTRISQAYPDGADVRRYPWRASHLKTFRASLLKHVKREWFQDDKGNWLQAASDVALMLPIMELAGLDRCRHIHEITYVWNDSPVSKAKRDLQKRCEAIVRAKPRETRLP